MSENFKLKFCITKNMIYDLLQQVSLFAWGLTALSAQIGYIVP